MDEKRGKNVLKLAISKFCGKIIRNDYIILRRDRMSVSFENKETNHGVLTFTISQEQIKPALDRVFESVKKTLNVPGFRKGHIPRPIFNQRFGEEALYQDALNDLLPAAYEAAVKEAGIEVVAQPTFDVVSMEKGQDWTLTAAVVKNLK